MKIVEFMWKDEDGNNKVVCENFDEVYEFCMNNNKKIFKVYGYEVE